MNPLGSLRFTGMIRLSLILVNSFFSVGAAQAQMAMKPAEASEYSAEHVRMMWAKAKMPDERIQCLSAWAAEGGLISVKAVMEAISTMKYENEREQMASLLRNVKSTKVLTSVLLSGVGEKKGQSMLVKLLVERADESLLSELAKQYEMASVPQNSKLLILNVVESVRNPSLRNALARIQEKALNKAPGVTLWPTATLVQIDDRASIEALGQAATKALATTSASVSASN